METTPLQAMKTILEYFDKHGMLPSDGAIVKVMRECVEFKSVRTDVGNLIHAVDIALSEAKEHSLDYVTITKDGYQAMQEALESIAAVKSIRAHFVKGYDPVTHVYHVGGHKFSVEDLEGVADGLDCYEKSVNVGNVTGEGEEHLESTTAFASRFIRLHLAPATASQIDKHAFYNVRLGKPYGAFQFRPDELVYVTHSPQCIRELMTYNMIRAQSGDLHGRLDCARFDELKAHIGTLDKGRDTGDNQMRAANIAMQSEKENKA